MANIKVSEMTEATSFDDGDYTMIVQANQNKKISKENIFSNLENEISTNASDISTINTNIGNLSNLATEDKTSIVNSINELKNAEVYSTNEVKTNKIWIDGKPIYRKVLSLTTPSTTGSWVTIGNLSYETIVDFYGTIIGGDGRYVPLNHGEPSYEVVTSIKNQEIQVRAYSTVWTSKTIIIIAEYTKATD